MLIILPNIQSIQLQYQHTHMHTHTPTHTPYTRQHRTLPSSAPTPTQLDDQQSLTPSYALHLCSLKWLTAAIICCLSKITSNSNQIFKVGRMQVNNQTSWFEDTAIFSFSNKTTELIPNRRIKNVHRWADNLEKN